MQADCSYGLECQHTLYGTAASSRSKALCRSVVTMTRWSSREYMSLTLPWDICQHSCSLPNGDAWQQDTAALHLHTTVCFPILRSDWTRQLPYPASMADSISGDRFPRVCTALQEAVQQWALELLCICGDNFFQSSSRPIAQLLRFSRSLGSIPSFGQSKLVPAAR